jgi:hypothetical protein
MEEVANRKTREWPCGGPIDERGRSTIILTGAGRVAGIGTEDWGRGSG